MGSMWSNPDRIRELEALEKEPKPVELIHAPSGWNNNMTVCGRLMIGVKATTFEVDITCPRCKRGG